MVVERKRDGTTVWKFYRKQYKKARYRKWGERQLRYFDKSSPEWYGIIVW